MSAYLLCLCLISGGDKPVHGLAVPYSFGSAESRLMLIQSDKQSCYAVCQSQGGASRCFLIRGSGKSGSVKAFDLSVGTPYDIKVGVTVGHRLVLAGQRPGRLAISVWDGKEWMVPDIPHEVSTGLVVDARKAKEVDGVRFAVRVGRQRRELWLVKLVGDTVHSRFVARMSNELIRLDDRGGIVSVRSEGDKGDIVEYRDDRGATKSLLLDQTDVVDIACGQQGQIAIAVETEKGLGIAHVNRKAKSLKLGAIRHIEGAQFESLCELNYLVDGRLMVFCPNRNEGWRVTVLRWVEGAWAEDFQFDGKGLVRDFTAAILKDDVVVGWRKTPLR